jgi:GT2 family glycosyltransferase
LEFIDLFDDDAVSPLSLVARGNIESFDGHVLSGWAHDGTGAPISLRVIVNGETFCDLPADEERNKAATYGAEINETRFLIEIPERFHGKACVVELIDCRSDAPIIGSPFHIETMAFVPQRIEGNVERFDGRVLSGWASTGTNAPARLRIIINGEPYCEVLADEAHDDIVACGPAIIDAGFSVEIPQRFFAVKPCTVDVVDCATNTAIFGSPIKIDAPAPVAQFSIAFDSAVRRLIDASLIDTTVLMSNKLQKYYSFQETVYLFSRLTDAQRADVFLFFDSQYYANQFDKPLDDGINLLAHFFLIGLAQHIAPHPLIQPATMLRSRPDLFGSEMKIEHFVSALTLDWCDPSPFLWLTWYRARADVDANEGALLHYLRQGSSLNLPPNPYFQPDVYAANVFEAPRNGVALVKHFLAHGDCALAPSGERFDAAWYLSQHPEAKIEEAGPLQYFLAIGRYLGHMPCETAENSTGRIWLSAPTNDIANTENPAAILGRWVDFAKEIDSGNRARVEAFRERPICPVTIKDHVAALRKLAFDTITSPDIDILIPCYNEFEITVECLVALKRSRCQRNIRIILVDDASPDERMLLFGQVPGLTVIRNPKNLHFLRSCNRAFASTDAPFLLLLNNDTQVLDDAIDRLVDAIGRDERIGAAAPMILYPNGRLQEAGCTLRHDGESTMIGLGEDPARPRYGYRREIQYGSGAALLLKRDSLDGQLFDERFAPAYCEDADLCMRIRECGWRVVYEPEAQIIHHLSVSTSRGSERRRVQMARTNQQKLMEKWAPQLRRENHARVLAFYLPQFHPIDRNNVWWGRGFTEWTNVTRALPSFRGHYQPHLPADMGFYDLRRVEVMGEQQALARRYGVEGFVVYYYNFGGTRILGQPMETLALHPEIDFQFALCWANENWTRHWDGGERSMLMEQKYDSETLDLVALDMARFASDPRAIRVEGKPLVMIYRPLLIPEVNAVTDRLRAKFKEAGHPRIHLVYVESMEALESQVRPGELGFDASVEFPPQGVGEPYKRSVDVLKAGWEGSLYDYAGTARNAVLRQTVDFTRYPTVAPSWDNTARQPLKGTTLVGAEPELFQAYVERKLEEMLDSTVGENRLLFVNAWNEWAEGAHLEPDRGFGHRWLTALRLALIAKGVMP